MCVSSFVIYGSAIPCRHTIVSIIKTSGYNQLKRHTISRILVYTDISGKERHRQMDIDRVVAYRRLGGVVVSIMTQNPSHLGSIPAVGAILPISNTPVMYFSSLH